MRLQQRRAERGYLRSEQIGDGQFAKNRRHERRRNHSGGRSGPSLHFAAPAPPALPPPPPPAPPPPLVANFPGKQKIKAPNPAIPCATFASRRGPSNACR